MKNRILLLIVLFISFSFFTFAGTPAPSTANAAEMARTASGNAYLTGVLIIFVSLLVGYVSRKLYTYRRLAAVEA